MPRRALGPRLYFDKSRKAWAIRDGSRFIRTGCSASELKQAEIELRAYIGKKYKPPSGPDPLIADVLLAYSDDHLPRTKAADRAEHNIRNLARWWGTKKASEVTARACRDYAETRPAQAARRDLEVLRAALWYWHRERSRLSLLPSVVLPDKAAPRQRWLTRDEARRLRRAAMAWPHLYRFVIIGLMTGTRSGVILSLCWHWIDLDARIIHRREPGEAEDQRKRTPAVRISRRLARLLRRWKRRDKNCPYVVHYNGRQVRSIKRTWAMACARSGITGASPHTLRHTRATWLMQEGVDPWEAAGHLGMTVGVLSRTYGKHHPGYQEKASEV